MAGAARAFAEQLAALPFAVPRTTLVCNLGAATPRRAEALKQALAGQIAATVPWDACQDAIAERRVRCVLEVGPGSTLSRLWNAREPQVPARSIDEFRSAAAIADWVAAVLA
jgi:[acyl-carrier-protein] S-malonyltransferase